MPTQHPSSYTFYLHIKYMHRFGNVFRASNKCQPNIHPAIHSTSTSNTCIGLEMYFELQTNANPTSIQLYILPPHQIHASVWKCISSFKQMPTQHPSSYTFYLHIKYMHRFGNV